jgi:hypothetical protein
MTTPPWAGTLPLVLRNAQPEIELKGRRRVDKTMQEGAVSQATKGSKGVAMLAIAATVAAVAASALAAPAQAGPRCSDGALCLWKGKNYTGAKHKVTEPGELVKLPKAFNNRVSSVKNKWEFRAFVYENKDGTGQPFCLESGEKVPDLSAFFDEINNDVSSARLATNPGSCGP